MYYKCVLRTRLERHEEDAEEAVEDVILCRVCHACVPHRRLRQIRTLGSPE